MDQQAKRRKGEEAKQLKASEWLTHQNRLMAIRGGKVDLSSFVVAPPLRSELRAEVE